MSSSPASKRTSSTMWSSPNSKTPSTTDQSTNTTILPTSPPRNPATLLKSIPPNLRPQPDTPAYTLPIPPKPVTEAQKIIYEKEVLLRIVATPAESWEERDARVQARRKSLEVVAVARWGANLRDLDMLAAEKRRWDEYYEAVARGEEW